MGWEQMEASRLVFTSGWCTEMQHKCLLKTKANDVDLTWCGATEWGGQAATGHLPLAGLCCLCWASAFPAIQECVLHRTLYGNIGNKLHLCQQDYCSDSGSAAPLGTFHVPGPQAAMGGGTGHQLLQEWAPFQQCTKKFDWCYKLNGLINVLCKFLQQHDGESGITDWWVREVVA